MTARPTRSASTDPDDRSTTEYYVLGGGHVGKAVAAHLRAAGHATGFVDEAYESDDAPGRNGDPADVQTLRAAGVPDASTVVVATRSDRRNLLIAELVRAHFDVPEVRVVANVPERSDLFAASGHDPICATTALADAVAGDR